MMIKCLFLVAVIWTDDSVADGRSGTVESAGLR